MVVIAPNHPFHTGGVLADLTNRPQVPFAWCASGLVNKPLSSFPAFLTCLPVTQRANMSRFRIDNVIAQFMPTQSALNISGKMFRSIWYGPPNSTWLPVQTATGIQYATADLTIFDSDFDNNPLAWKIAVRDATLESTHLSMILDWDCQHFGEPVDDKPLVAGVPTLKNQPY